MYDFCPYCGKQLANGETCPTCRPREYNTYSEPTQSESSSTDYSNSNYNQPHNSNYNQHYSEQYEDERRRYDAEYKIKNDKKNIIIMSAISLVMGGESIFSFWSGFFALITGIISLVLAITANKKNKKLEKPLVVSKIALVVSIIALIVGVISTIAFAVFMFGDGLTVLIDN